MQNASTTVRGVAAGSSLPPRRARLLECDLVMKGGITSGVVYPKAVVRIARDYQVRNVGGTSVGAIAAALVAAAEYERQGHDAPVDAWDDELDRAIEADLAGTAASSAPGQTGYGALYDIPAALGNDLSARFQPRAGTRTLFRYVFRWILTFQTPVGRAVSALLLGLWWPRLLTVLAGLVLFGGIRLLDPSGEGRFSLVVGVVVMSAVLVGIRIFMPAIRLSLGVVVAIGGVGSLVVARLFWSLWFERSWAVFSGLGASLSFAEAWDELAGNLDSVLVDVAPWVVGFWIAGAALYLVWVVLHILPRNAFGLCTGLGDDGAITNWLHAAINRAANTDGAVLTFGDLAQPRTGEPDAGRGVRLAMIGTDLRRGVPLLMPRALAPDAIGEGRYANGYLFDPQVFRDYFPEEVVQALMAGGTADAAGRYPFPPAERIPVLVPARMSMSFPILFSAVPVVYCDSAGETWDTWISDGGIVSNFPSYLFDRPLPPWPTFGLDLIDVDDDRDATPPDRQYMFRWLLPARPYSYSSEERNPERLPTRRIETVPGFLMSAVNAARGWVDNSQKRLPGFAERIVGVNIYPGEGGLNLTMERSKIERLAGRGLRATDRLLRNWDPDGEWSQWRYHRWLRMRTLMRELEEIGEQWDTWYATPGEFGLLESFADMAAEVPGRAGVSVDAYPYPIVAAGDRQRAERLIALFSAFADHAGQAASAGGVDEAGGRIGARAAEIVFDAPDSPSPNPDLLLMPPFE